MLKHLLFYMLAAHAALCTPLPTDVATSHIVIVTPQAQVHLEPGLKYDTAGTFIHHLSPLARFAAPHEETIVFVPASAAAPILTPIDSVSVIGRTSGATSNNKEQPLKPETKQLEQIAQQIQQAVQQGTAQLGPQLSDAAAAAAAAASAAGQGLFPALFPTPSVSSAPISPATLSIKQEEADKLKVGYETPANTEPLLPANARVYALTPSISHIVDFVHTPVFVGPLSAVRARSIQSAEAELPTVAQLPTAESKPEAQPLLQSDVKQLPQAQAQAEAQAQSLPLTAAAAAEPENKSEFGRFLEANALKDEQQKEPIKSEQPKDSLSAASNQLLDLAKPTLPAAESASQLKSAAAAIVKDEVVDVVPQSKVA